MIYFYFILNSISKNLRNPWTVFEFMSLLSIFKYRTNIFGEKVLWRLNYMDQKQNHCGLIINIKSLKIDAKGSSYDRLDQVTAEIDFYLFAFIPSAFQLIHKKC